MKYLKLGLNDKVREGRPQERLGRVRGQVPWMKNSIYSLAGLTGGGYSPTITANVRSAAWRRRDFKAQISNLRKSLF